jgi:branched-chain amino acid transport system ATP-binding protein
MSTALSAQHVSVSFDGLKALSNVVLDIPPARVTGLIGPNGAGKTTLVNVLTGFQAPDQGQVLLEGQPIGGKTTFGIRRLGIARTFQSGRLFSELSVIDNLEVTGIGLGLTRREAAAKAEAMLDWIGIAALTDRIAGGLPYTDERRVAIGRALMMEPRYLLLDEPAAGMAAEEADELIRLISDSSSISATISMCSIQARSSKRVPRPRSRRARRSAMPIWARRPRPEVQSYEPAQGRQHHRALWPPHRSAQHLSHRR